MGELDSGQQSANVNVMLAPRDKDPGGLYDKEFPCFLCGAGLLIKRSKRNKPYWTCNDCGMQTFIRGKEGIARLQRMANAGILISTKDKSAGHAINLLNRLDQLKLQKRELEQKLGLIFKDSNVENAIEIVDSEIESVQSELAKIASSKRKEPLK
jgi:hypothetical protein